MRIGMDAMSGDFAPREIVRGAADGLRFLSDQDEVVLYGVQEQVAAECREMGLTDPRVSIQHCPEVIGMDDSPMEALRYE